MTQRMNTKGYNWYYGRLKDKCQSPQDKSWLDYVNRWGCALQRRTTKKPIDWRMVCNVGKALDPENKHNYGEALIAVILAWNHGWDIIDAYHNDIVLVRRSIDSERRAYNYEVKTSTPWHFWLTQEAVFAKGAVADGCGEERKNKHGIALLSGSIRAFKRWGYERVLE